jgi:hypothetical protein
MKEWDQNGCGGKKGPGLRSDVWKWATVATPSPAGNRSYYIPWKIVRRGALIGAGVVVIGGMIYFTGGAAAPALLAL